MVYLTSPENSSICEQRVELSSTGSTLENSDMKQNLLITPGLPEMAKFDQNSSSNLCENS